MKRDKLEQLLQQKLERAEVTPPADLWSRLETQLPAIRRELAFGAGEETTPEADALPAPKIRRPLRQRMRWAYAIASVAALGMVIFTMNNLSRMEDMVADGTEQPPQKELPLPIIEPPVQLLDTGDNTDTATALPVAGSSYAIATPSTRVMIPADDGNADMTGSQGATPTEDDTLKEYPVTVTEPTRYETTPRTDTPQATQDKSSDKERQEEFAAWIARVRAEDGRRTRRTGPVAMSLYAANTTGVTGNGTVTGRAKLQKSSLIVTETTELPGEETASSGSYASGTNAKLKHDLPLAFGASVNIGLTDRLSLETGLTYTYMRSKGETVNPGASVITNQKLHYLGIPVKIKYDFLQTRFIDLYAGAGGSVEKMLSGKRTYVDYYDGIKTTEQKEKLKVGSLQTSVGANLGVEFNIDKTFGLYVEPGVGYFFKNSNQIESYRTENPFNFTIKAGFRIQL